MTQGRPTLAGSRSWPRLGPGVGRDPRSNVWVMALTSGGLNLVSLVWSPVLPLILHRRGASPFEVVVAYAAFGLMSYAFQYLGGVWADRQGRRRAIILPTLMAGLSYLVAAQAHGWLVTAAAITLVNVCFGLQSPSFVTVLADSVPPGERASVFARFQFAVGVASVVGPALGGFVLLRLLSPQTLLTVTGFAYLAAGTARLVYLAEPPAPPRRAGAPRLGLRDLLHGPGGRLLAVTLGFTLTLALTVNGPFLALFGHRVRELAASQIDLLFAVGPMGAVAVSHLAGRWVRRHGSGPALAAGLVVHTLSLVSWTWLTGLLGSGLVFFAAYAGYQVATVAFSEYRVDQAGSSGALIGATGSLAGAASVGGPPLGGVVYGLWPAGTWLLAAAAALATAALARGRPAPRTP